MTDDSMTLEQWAARVAEALDLGADYPVDIELALDVARDAAHAVMRPAAPLTTLLVGIAAGRAGGDAEAVRRASAAVTALIAETSQAG
jgi:hypothetical protein